ncbi:MULTISPECIES: hypothetical protein [Streptosporangium]|uniref:Ig-like domain-containing protein n=1 Tax=Streptosporangium brasiliense TaxID=47480 RepID=A0ABT9QZR3_9ACTN|nr:hypothetical protein [Streptosporangium brasiliense]MDP9862442.1 hypothetical protein [Streptosporangium brasiliense]
MIAILAMGTAIGGVAVATPATAASGPVTVSAAKASPARYNGDCPVNVSFAAVVKGRPGTKIKYRWLRGDGAAGAVRTAVLTGRVTLWDRRTFTTDTRSWQALQVLGARGRTSKKVRFQVSCQGSVTVQPDPASTVRPTSSASPSPTRTPSVPPATPAPNGTPRPTASGTPTAPQATASATVTGINRGDYEGPCWTPFYWNTTGTLKVSRVPATVKYRWIDSNGWKSQEQTREFTQGGAAEVPVNYEERVAFDTRSGWRAIEILSPAGSVVSNKFPYAIKCTDATDATVTVTALRPNYRGPCPPADSDEGAADLPFSVRFEAEKKPAIVKFRRIWNGVPGPVEEVRLNEMHRSFTAHRPITEGGVVSLAIEVNGVRSEVATSTVTCEDGTPPTADAQVESVKVAKESLYLYYCGWNADYRQYLSGDITAKGPGRVPYRWVLDFGSYTRTSAVRTAFFHDQGPRTEHAVLGMQPTYNTSASVWLELFPGTPKAVKSNVGNYKVSCRL